MSIATRIGIVLMLATACANASGLPQAHAPSGCTVVGTRGDDVLAGTRHGDELCGLAGHDYLAGDGSKDVLRGFGGPDVLVGNHGADHLSGGPGDDQIFAVDGKATDMIQGRRGFDRCYADPGDRVVQCERVFRGVSVTETNAISSSLYGGFVQALLNTFEPCTHKGSPEPC